MWTSLVCMLNQPLNLWGKKGVSRFIESQYKMVLMKLRLTCDVVSKQSAASEAHHRPRNSCNSIVDPSQSIIWEGFWQVDYRIELDDCFFDLFANWSRQYSPVENFGFAAGDLLLCEIELLMFGWMWLWQMKTVGRPEKITTGTDFSRVSGLYFNYDYRRML